MIAAGVAALCCTVVAASVLATTGIAHGAKRGGLKLGIWGDLDPQSLDRTVDVGAQQVTIQANWRNIASSRPADPANANDPAYDFAQLDAAVRDATARGLSVMVMVLQAPDWAEGPNRDPNADPGSWRPDPHLLGQFTRALGRRYSGGFPDPLASGRSLPPVRLWQIWAEPNWEHFVSPQWVKSGGKWRPAAPAHYRKMVNVAYSALNDVDRANRVIAGGLIPVGDYKPGGGRFEPVRFLREFFCLRGRRALKPKKCRGKKPHLDVLGHNPLSGFFTDSAFKSAAQPDDVWPPDMHKLTRVIRAARKHKRIAPRRGTDLWVTELLAFSERPYGINQTTQANYLADALFVLWKQGVSLVTWVGIKDATGAYSSVGLFDDNGNPKLASKAFHFPFVARGKSKQRVRVWGKAPVNGGVNIERQTGSGWEVIKTLGTKRHIFTGRIKGPQKAPLRATAGGEQSLTR